MWGKSGRERDRVRARAIVRVKAMVRVVDMVRVRMFVMLARDSAHINQRGFSRGLEIKVLVRVWVIIRVSVVL